MKVPGNSFVFKLDQIVFEGVGPLSLEVARGDDRVVYLDDSRDGMTLIGIIKGMISPLDGAVVKGNGDTTGWIVRDGIIALAGEDFFSKTVQDEIAFSAKVGEAKGTVEMEVFLPVALERSGLGSRLDRDIRELSDFERHMLILTSALCMLPDCLVFLDPLRGFDEVQSTRYLDLLRYGKGMVGFATLQILPEGQAPISLETPPVAEGYRDERRRP
jgi:ABC-type taurine transport system ATPase subunit